jgi:predicted transcriptional regulator
MSGQTKQISFSIDEEKYEIVEKLADAFGKDIDGIVKEAVDQYIEQNEWKIAHINKETEDKKKKETAQSIDSESIFDKHTQS